MADGGERAEQRDVRVDRVHKDRVRVLEAPVGLEIITVHEGVEGRPSGVASDDFVELALGSRSCCGDTLVEDLACETARVATKRVANARDACLGVCVPSALHFH